MTQTDDFSALRTAFDEYYYQKIYPKLAELEPVRLKYLHRFWMLVFLMLIGLPILILMAFGEVVCTFLVNAYYQDSGEFIKNCFLSVCLLLFILGMPIVYYKKKVKSSVIDDFIGFFGSFKHCDDKRIEDKIINDSLLFGRYNTHKGDDYFQGVYKNTPMVIAEEELRQKSSKNSVTVFKGIMILIKLPKPVIGQTVVRKDAGMFNFLNRFKGSLQNIKLEDVVFEKEFEVYGDNQIEARFLLTTAFMERILRVKKLFHGKSVEFSFADNSLLIAIRTGKDMFEPSSLFRVTTDKRPVNQVLEQFLAVFAIADILKLTQQ